MHQVKLKIINNYTIGRNFKVIDFQMIISGKKIAGEG